MNRKSSKSKGKLSVSKEALRKLSEQSMRSAAGGCCYANNSEWAKHTVQSYCCASCWCPGKQY
jgi:hypothetical protein